MQQNISMIYMEKTLVVLILTWVISLSPGVVNSQEPSESTYMPEIHGTVRAKYEYEPQIEKGRFEVRNARLSVEGRVVPIVRYKAEIDLSDEGAIKMLDAYVRLQPDNRLKFTIGQMRVPFTIDAHRSPHLQYFANRSFIAKQVGNVRDVGASVSWTFGHSVPVTLEGGVFNGSGLTNQKNFWTGNINFSLKAYTFVARRFNVTLSCQKATMGDVNVMMYDAGTYWDDGRWHIEAEYLRKYYAHDSFRAVDAVDAFAAYRLPLKKWLSAISFLGRYDYMSDHSNGHEGEDGLLATNDPARHRLTGGVTLSLGKGRLQADIRLNYEQYFYSKSTIPAISEQNKVVVEFVAHF